MILESLFSFLNEESIKLFMKFNFVKKKRMSYSTKIMTTCSIEFGFETFCIYFRLISHSDQVYNNL